MYLPRSILGPLAICLIASCGARATPVDFAKDVRPIFQSACVSCHGDAKQKGGLRLDGRDAALKGGDDGVVIVPHHAAESVLLQYVVGADPDKRMPPKGDPLTPQQTATIKAWIEQGAQWPSDGPAVAANDKRDHWAFKAIARVTPPEVKGARNPVDAFVLAKLAEQYLSPAPQADKRTLIRRVTFDLTGLPPTPEEVSAFVADESPTAYEKVVDRLLASPRYGERWARHWMDLVHFAESHGEDQDRERPNAWPYRDYLVRSFNADKPFARFVEEQVAGDALCPDDPQATVATGLIAAGPWDESAQMFIMDDTVDKLAARNLDRDDMVVTAVTSFTSTTVQCARCHNHKFDPISQSDYYGLQAVFAGVDRADRPYDPDPAVFRERMSLSRQKRGLETGKYEAMASPFDPRTRAELAAWEQGFKDRDRVWTALNTEKVTTTNGSILTEQPDHSLLATGPRPEEDSYVITTTTPLGGITAIRLEALADPSLPSGGPGRQENGNFALTEFHVSASPISGAGCENVAIATARSDFDQEGWGVAASVDGSQATGWSVFPNVGRSHVGVYAFAQPVGFPGGTKLTIRLDQKLGRHHLLGRVRLSVTTHTAPATIELRRVPDDVAAILGTPTASRSEAQSLALATYYLNSRVDRALAALPPQSAVYAASKGFAPRNQFTAAVGPRPVFVLKRGEVTQPAEPAVPGGLSFVPGLPGNFDLRNPGDEASRRAALAKWLSDPRNCLTWRSIVNRAWQYRFGRGIVSTPNDFGHMGAAPTHPELLDWLATFFLQSGGSLKTLDRLLVTSATYRQSTRLDAHAVEQDADNRYLWRMNRTRLDAEGVRDSILQMSGTLDTTMGGPSARQFIQKPGVHITPLLDYAAFDPDSPAMRRLSIYRFLWRTVPDPFMDTLDYADGSQLSSGRSVSVTALQALAMMNDCFVVRYSEHLAERLTKERPDVASRIAELYELALSREPTREEVTALSEFIGKHGLGNACRVVVNSSEFMFAN